MNKKTFFITISTVLIIAGTVNATLFVSGDSNIGTSLNSGYGSDLDLGNQQFFTNILGSGSNVLVLDGVTDSVDMSVNYFYNSLPSVTSEIVTGGLTGSALLGVDLLFSFFPSDDFTSEEIEALDQYLNGGGSAFFAGDIDLGVNQNLYVNNALEALGSGMRISEFNWAPGYLTATGSNIADDPFTAGVETFSYAAEYEVLGGTPLFFSTITNQQNAFIAYESMAPVPEPATIILLGTGLIGIVGASRKRFLKR